jgi:hypothetical protein
LRSGFCAGQPSSSTPISTNNFCMDLALCMGQTGKGLSQTVATKLEAQNCLDRITVKFAGVLRFPFTRTKGPSPRSFPSNSKLYSYLLCIVSGNVLLAKTIFVCRTARWWSMIHHYRERVSNAPESKGSELYTTPANACSCAWWS